MPGQHEHAPGYLGESELQDGPPRANRPAGPSGQPTARGRTRPPSCTGLSCSFDASASWDPDGDEISFTWDLGDGSEAEGATVEHTYPQPGVYPYVVEVRDAQGSADTVRTTIDVSLEPEVPIGFRAASGAVANATSVAPRVPSAAESGDALLLSVAANRSDAVLAAPAGWQPLGRQVDESMQSSVWVRVAQDGDAGSTVPVSASRTTKMVAQVLAYTGN